ncbi:MAG TPA: hypothetical protein VFS13_06020 [Steroidobacteraceae bacterium]|nr:hypothetical protein [Steroidobacteraceae bacterium]
MANVAIRAVGLRTGAAAMKIDPLFKPLPPEPATLLTEGRLVEAIKVLRESEGISLTRAKQWIDWHIDQDPMLRVQIETQQRASRRKFFFWFIVIDVLITVAIIYYLRHVPG